MGHRKGSPEREVHSNTGILRKTEKSQTNNLTLHLQELGIQKQSPEQVEVRTQSRSEQK